MKWIPVLTIVLKMLTTLVFGCPSEVCICKWKGGKQTVECGGRQLTALPIGMDPGTQVLNFSGNSLQIITSEKFLKMDLINLQKIYMSRNQIMRIHDRAFKGLSNLVELDLSDNMLTTIPTESFQDYSSLMRLSLNGNPIREIKTSAFKHLSSLTTLELSGCQIEKIEDEAFMGMDNLEWLHLDGNRLNTIRGNRILPQNLHGVSLQNNRWACDCHLLDVHVWLNVVNVPQTQEPKCISPDKFSGNPIKAIQTDELACLPVISPTTLYLEVAEGRNISLLCKISAVPEATISWWFQGHILQNDTILMPNLHLWYYVEEGVEEKRSELFIYNSNADDNGTFTCIAENPAGRTQANYTIKVIVKEEPIMEEVSIPYEFFLIVAICAGFLGLLVIVACCVIIVKCRRTTKRKKKKNCGKDVALQYQNNQIKCSSLSADSHEQLVSQKSNGCISIGSERNPQEMMMYVTNTSVNINSNDPNNLCSDQYCSPPSARNYQEQNPDLINDAESVNKTRLRNDNNDDEKGSSGPSSLQESIHAASESGYDMKAPMVRQIPARFSAMSTLPRGMTREMYQHQVDVHLNPGCFLGPDGYPLDYGLPKMPMMAQVYPPGNNNPVNYYRTLPHNRNKMVSAANPAARFSREAEFLTRTQPYETYGPNEIRYTAEGYPANQQLGDGSNFPSPPEGYKGDSLQLHHNNMAAPQVCCPSPSSQQQWPSYVPAYQMMPINGLIHELKRYPSPQPSLLSPTLQTAPVTKRCVGAQTNDPDKDTIPEQREEEELAEESKTRHLTGPLADSPDEGYVGDSQEGSDM